MFTRLVLMGVCLSALVVASGTLAQDQGGKGEIKLFNGKDLSGWKPFLDPRRKVPVEAIFQVKDGVLVVDGSVPGYLRTDKDYSNYVLKLEWRWGDKKKGGRNSGVFVHVVGPDKIWPKGAEAQLMAGSAGDFWLVDGFKLDVDKKRQDPKVPRHFFRMKDNVEKEIGEWNQYEITCKGDEIQLKVNGELVNVGTNAEISKGGIILQSEGAEIHFRNITLTPLE